MVELFVASSVVAGLIFASTRRQERPLSRQREFATVASGRPVETVQVPELFGEAPDLPCPWCQGPTREEDTSCPSCGQRFG